MERELGLEGEQEFVTVLQIKHSVSKSVQVRMPGAFLSRSQVRTGFCTQCDVGEQLGEAGWGGVGMGVQLKQCRRIQGALASRVDDNPCADTRA